MSNKELDSLFKKKLNTVEKQPSAAAWEKIAAQTAPAKKKGAYWVLARVAASILILLIAGIAIWKFGTDPTTHEQIADTNDNSVEPIETQEALSDSTSKDSESTRTISEPDNQELLIAHRKEEMEQAEKAPITGQKTINKVQDQRKTSIPEKDELSEVAESVEIVVEQTENLQANATKPDKSSSGSQATGTTLEFDLSDFKDTAMATNTLQSEEEAKKTDNKKGIKKVIKFMKDVKDEAGIGELREAKNELFAFNFNKDENDGSE